ncbi:histidyl-tRNA synthase [Rhodomicrobium udaipurense JA643]|uniref:Histidine--tRNA ligase n=1 Tax=Rhodomicrobium udaipurense TaxID=1202716 RepID=A0A8I1KLQ5_9HYPH|nr:histidine--tRNA ligase [Rhodomicrobium udaipurense]KAI94427.1 histidyl-tRNA synthase [Rhodomicrobium udaipurense JA643]MBJ7543868.1 histidine--tRNA ligase [Rhodomicrobium udaipurense]
MSDKKPSKTQVKARLPKGMRDVEAQELRALKHMLDTISEVYERYGFEPLDTPAFEYTDALGKFLPDTDRPNEGVFSFQDEDEQWVSMRYDLTAPLARYVAQNFDATPKPFRRYQTGYVYRNEKPGPGRFRQFMQFDADTVGTANPAADAEMCMLAADTLEALGIPRGGYIIKVSNRKLLDGVMDAIGISGVENATRRLTVLRAIDKLDKFGWDEVELLLGSGRKDESGDFTKGAELTPLQVRKIREYLSWESIALFRSSVQTHRQERLERDIEIAENLLGESDLIEAGLRELFDIEVLVRSAGYGHNRICIDSSVVRGLEYYTGPVFEAELTFRATDESGQAVRFGSVGGGGRYDGLVSRFRSQPVPATGFSIGVSRLYAALSHLGKIGAAKAAGPVVVLVMDKARVGDYQCMAKQLRDAGIRAEMYVGDAGMKAQMKYADKRGSPAVIIQGEDERAKGEVTIKDLLEGSRLSGEISDHAEWKEARPAQFSVSEGDLVAAVQKLLAEQAKA